MIVASGDLRTAWIISDLMRIATDPGLAGLLAAAASELMGVDIDSRNPWGATADTLIAWDVPAPPGYLAVKRGIYTLVVPEWERIFLPGEIDWRALSANRR